MSDSTEQGQVFSDAAYAGDIAKLQAMLAESFDINTPDADGFTALHRSCVTGNIDVIKFLVEQGADVNAEDSYGDSPMHYACFCGHVDAVQTLITSGADPAKPSRDGKTPLESAREEGHDEVVRLLSVSQSGNKVAGLDFSTGVIIEGELRKKRANRVVKWRRKYYVLSKTYGAMFFWTGTRSHVEGVIKKVRFETFLSVRHHKQQKGGRRFDIRVVTGRTMELLASSESDALHWVSTIKEHLGDIMAVIRVQSAFRTYKARKELRRLINQRKLAVKRLMATRRQSILAVGGIGASILMEGPLKKKNTRSLSRLLSKFRTRYFVLNAAEGALQYFENKTKRKLNVNPRSVPFMSLYSVTHLRDKKGKLTTAFELRIMSGRVFEFHGKNMGDTVKWVTKLLSVLPRDNVAAVKIQSVWRMRLAKKELARRRAVMKGQRAEVEERYGKPYEDVLKATRKIQAVGRGHIVRTKHRRGKKAREAQEAAAKASSAASSSARKRLYLKKHGSAAAASKPGAGAAASKATGSRLARLHALRGRRAKMAQHADGDGDEDGGDGGDDAAESGDVPPPRPPPGAPPPNAKRITGTGAGGAGAGGSGAAAPAPAPVDVGGPLGGIAEGDESEDEGDAAAPAPAPAAAPAAAGADGEEDEVIGEWTELHDPDTGASYWHNAATDETTWDEPDAVKKARLAAASSDWIAVVDDESGDTYYVNQTTMESSWEKPPGFKEPGEGDTDAADDASEKANPNAPWIAAVDPDSGDTYYINEETAESSWTPPPGWVEPGSEASAAAPKTHNGWTAVVDDDSGDVYYVHEESGQSSWDKPEGWPEDDAAAEADGDDGGADADADADAEEWLELVDPESDEKYYYNNKTGERRWTNPHKQSHEGVASDVDSDDEDAGHDEADSEDDLDEDAAWVEMTDPTSNDTYYFNSVTQETSWTRPAALGGKRKDEYRVNEHELYAFCVFVNQLLADDEKCGPLLPLDGTAMPPAGLFSAVRNGALLARIINSVQSNTIDERVVRWDAVAADAEPEGASGGSDGDDERKHSHAHDNLNLCLQSAGVLGAVLADVTPESLERGDAKATMDTVWQLFKVYLLKDMSLQATPSLILLKTEDEELSELMSLTPEQLLVRWANYQLSDTTRTIAHLGTDMSDCVGYALLLHSLAPAESAATGLPSSTEDLAAMGVAELAPLVVSTLEAVGVPAMFTPGALTSTNTRLHLSVLGMLFRSKAGLDTSDATADASDDVSAGAAGSDAATDAAAAPARKAGKKRKVNAADLEALNRELADIMQEEEHDKTREVRTMQLWVNSLHIKGVYVNNLIRDVKEGVLTLKVLDRVEPGIVKWKKAHLKPSNKYRCIENSMLAISIGKAMDFVLLGVGPMDFYNGNRKMILAFWWQLMRYHTLKLVSSLGADGFEVSEGDILDWANERVDDAGYADLRLRSFKDSSVKTSHFLLRLLHSVRPIVNWSVVTPGNSEDERAKNAQYVVSIARAAGATVCLSWEDIVEGNAKMIMILVAGIMKATTQVDEDEDDDMFGDDFGDDDDAFGF